MRWKGDESDDEDEDVEKNKCKKKKKRKTPTKAKNKKNKPAAKPPAQKPRSNTRTTTTTEPSGPCAYKAGDFAEERKAYLAKLRESGTSHKEACTMWTASERRAELIQNMSHAEQVRRRFVKPLNPRNKKAA